jgi:hypothetical protein
LSQFSRISLNFEEQVESPLSWLSSVISKKILRFITCSSSRSNELNLAHIAKEWPFNFKHCSSTVLHKVRSWNSEFYFPLHNIIFANQFPTSGIRANFKENIVKKVVYRNLFGYFCFVKFGFFFWISKDCKIVPRPRWLSLTCQDLYWKISSRLEIVFYFNYFLHSKHMLLYFKTSMCGLWFLIDAYREVLKKKLTLVSACKNCGWSYGPNKFAFWFLSKELWSIHH